MNAKYEITDIAHEKYSFLHRIRALRDIGRTVKTGDLGGFVENEDNLSFESGDGSWIFDDAIAAGDSRVQNASTTGLWSAAAPVYPTVLQCMMIPKQRMQPTFGGQRCASVRESPGMA